MSEKNRSAYVLQRGDGLSISEVAALLGTTCNVVKQRTHRAQEQIRKALRHAGWADEVVHLEKCHQDAAAAYLLSERSP